MEVGCDAGVGCQRCRVLHFPFPALSSTLALQAWKTLAERPKTKLSFVSSPSVFRTVTGVLHATCVALSKRNEMRQSACMCQASILPRHQEGVSAWHEHYIRYRMLRVAQKTPQSHNVIW
eukprot:2135905-Amphidinium_carterae.1